MGDAVDWFARKAGTQPSQGRQYGIQVPAQAPVPQQQPAPQGGSPAHAGTVGTEQQGELSTSDMLAGKGVSKGSVATKTETMNCPECGSRNFFSNRNSMIVRPDSGEQIPANPKCFECGYNGRYSQGEAASWA